MKGREFGSRIEITPVVVQTHELGDLPATKVNTIYDGTPVWGKTIYPFFCRPAQELGLKIPKPFYAKRVELAIKKAGQIAKKLNRIS